MTKQLTTEDLAQRINSSWRKTTEGVLETAKLCFEADQRFPDPMGRKRFVDQLHFDQSTFSKLIRIGKNQELYEDPVRTALPGNYSVVYEVAKLDEEELETALKERILKPNMTRRSLRNWVAQRRASSEQHEQDAKPQVICTLQTKKTLNAKRRAALEKSLEDLQQKYGLIVQRPLDREEQQLNTLDKKVLHRIRYRAQEFIDRLISQARAKATSEGQQFTEDDQNWWRFSDEEDKIPKEATWDEIREHLDRLGHSDQFERLIEEALVVNGVAEDGLKDQPPRNHEQAIELLKGAVSRQDGEQGTEQP